MMEIKLEPVSIDDASKVSGIQLYEQTGVRLAVAIGGNLASITGAAGPAKAVVVTVMRLGRGWESPAWEARPLEDGTFASVYTQAGSAVCWIMSQGSRDAKGERLHVDTFAVFGQPHYVRGQTDGHPVSAIQYKDGKSQVVIFTADPSIGLVSSQDAGDALDSVADARLSRDANGYWLFLLMRVPGAVEIVTARSTGTGTRTPTLLHAIRLNDDLKPAGSLIRVLGDHPVYEFDVEPAAGDQVAIFATTPSGAIYGTGSLKDGPLPAGNWKETLSEEPLSSPSLLWRDDVAYLAALENAGAANARVLRGQTD